MRKFLTSLIIFYTFTNLMRVYSADLVLFENLFKSSGFEVNKISRYADYSKEAVSVDYQKKFDTFLFLTLLNDNNTLLKNLVGLENKNVFIICNSKYFEYQFFTCTDKEIKFDDMNEGVKKFSFYDKEGGQVELFYKKYKGNNFFLISETNLISINQQTIFKDYLVSLKKSQNLTPTNLVNIEENNSIRQIPTSFAYELFTYVVFIFIVMSLILNLMIYFKNNYNRLSYPKIFEEIKFSFLGFFNRNIYLKLVFLGLITFYILTYFIFYLNDTSILLNNSKITNEGPIIYKIYSIFNIYFFSFLLLTFVISRIDILYLIYIKCKSKYSNLRFKFPLFTKLFTFFIFLIFYVFNIFFEIHQAVFLLLFLFIFSYFISNKSLYDSSLLSLNLRKKILISFISFLIIILLLILSRIEFKKRYNYEDLVNVSDSIVSLPYKKDIGKYNLIKHSNLSFNTSIFVDTILIYHPDYSVVKNLNIKEFDYMNTNFIFTSDNKESLIQEVLKNNKIIKNTQKEMFSFFNLVSIKEPQENYISITVDCSKVNEKEFKIKIFTYNVNKKFDVVDLKLGYLLSCDSGLKEYEFELPPELMNVSNVVIELDRTQLSYIRSFKIYNHSDLKSLELYGFEISLDKVFPYILSFSNKNDKDKKELVNYNLLDKKKIFNNSDDISDSINSLILDGSIKSEFYIWSHEDVSIIKNKYKKSTN